MAARPIAAPWPRADDISQAETVSSLSGRRPGSSAMETQPELPGKEPARPNRPPATVLAPPTAVPWWPRPDASRTWAGVPSQAASSMWSSSTRPAGDTAGGMGTGVGVAATGVVGVLLPEPPQPVARTRTAAASPRVERRIRFIVTLVET